MAGFIPLTREEMLAQGWHYMDFVLISGDAYVDHPSFGVAIIARVLEHAGYKVGIVAQPQKDEDYLEFGRPRYAFMVSSGNIDSMVNHYTVAKRKRSEDLYTPNKKAGRRPDRAVIVYTQALKRLFPEIPVVIGGVEASLRRFAHYDYWDDKVRPSILLDSGADLLSYGMGERQTVLIARALTRKNWLEECRDVRGVCYLDDGNHLPQNAVSCASFEKVAADKVAYANATRIQYEEQDYIYGRAIVQKHGTQFLVQNRPQPPLTREELDAVWELPFQKRWHPKYDSCGGIAAIEEVEFSIMHNRGCFGACNFCAIAFHQGRHVTSRSEESILKEAEEMVKSPRFKGYIHDVGGPTANFRGPSCQKQITQGLCKGRKCLSPTPCKQIKADHREYLQILRKLRAIKGVKKVFVRSGLRFDYMLLDPDETFFKELVQYHVSGQLKVAPEHCSNNVLAKMGKPPIEAYEKFQKRFFELSRQCGKEQYLVPYLMSSHPGSTLQDAVTLAVFLKKNHIHPEQVQDFYPTPGTVSTCMFYTGLDPFSMQPVYVAKTPQEKAMQRVLLQYYKPENAPKVRAALKAAGREDLIGFGKECLVRPDARFAAANSKTSAKNGAKGVPNARAAHQTGKGRQAGFSKNTAPTGRQKQNQAANKKRKRG